MTAIGAYVYAFLYAPCFLLEEAGLAGVSPHFFNDCLLAATAREEGHRIVTHNLADFERVASVEPSAAPLLPFP